MVGVDPAGARQATIEPLILERREARGVRGLDRDRFEGDGGILQNTIDDGLVFFRGERAGGVEYRTARARKGDGSPEKRLLPQRHLPPELGGLPSRLPAFPAQRPFGRTRGVHQHPVEQRSVRQRPSVPGDHEHVGVHRTVHVPKEGPDPVLVPIHRHDAAPVLHEVGDVGGLSPRSRA